MNYDPMSRPNHWIIATAMIGMLLFGLYLEYSGLEREARRPLIGIHRWIAVLVLLYGTWPVVWRLVKGFSQPAAHMPPWQVQASRAAHWSPLAGIPLMPLSGIGFTVFGGRYVDVFGWFSIAAAAEAPWIVSLSSVLYSYVGYGLCVIVVLHIAAVRSRALICTLFRSNECMITRKK